MPNDHKLLDLEAKLKSADLRSQGYIGWNNSKFYRVTGNYFIIYCKDIGEPDNYVLRHIYKRIGPP